MEMGKTQSKCIPIPRFGLSPSLAFSLSLSLVYSDFMQVYALVFALKNCLLLIQRYSLNEILAMNYFMHILPFFFSSIFLSSFSFK